jgi:hypothetical protein
MPLVTVGQDQFTRLFVSRPRWLCVWRMDWKATDGAFFESYVDRMQIAHNFNR